MRIAGIILLAVMGAGVAFGQTEPAATTTAAATMSKARGETITFTFADSKIFPGTSRTVWVYVPREYDGTKPACLIVDQDKLQFNLPQVMDELIASKEMPVAIAVGVAPGVVKAAGENALARYNRSFEFDSLGDAYARFLLEELLPAVEKMKTGDGRAIAFSTNPDDRMICGSSSGGIAAFTVAWERPESFHRVFTAIGTFVNLRGGNVYPLLVRKFEPKPIRMYLQDGSADHNHYGGDWWMANQEMERALTYTGYEVNHYWGVLGHVHTDADKVFPDAMRWLWKDYPNGVKKGLGSEQLQQILYPVEGWRSVEESSTNHDGLTVDSVGNLFFSEAGRTAQYKATGGGPEDFANVSQGGQAIGPDGKLYGVSGGTHEVRVYGVDGKYTVLAKDVHGNDVAVRANGDLYVTQSGGTATPQVLLIKKDGTKIFLETGLKFPNGICFSPDQTLLYVDDYRSHWVYSYQIQPDGTLADKQKFYDLYVRDQDDDAGADGMKVDQDGRLYVSTRSGIQVCDQAGRVIAIIPTPNGKVSSLAFGGKGFDMLYAACGQVLYARLVKVKGIDPSAGPIKPAPPKL